MGTLTKLNRREFLKVSAAAGGGLLIGLYLPGCDRRGAESDVGATGTDSSHPAAKVNEASFEPNAWIRIGSDDSVTIVVGSSEMGQGVMTSIPMLVAEELDADWDLVRAEFAPAAKAFTNPIIGQQLTGGSTAIRGFWDICRKAGATGRDMLVAAAAKQWGVEPDTCRTERNTVIHPKSGRKLRYGALADAAAQQPVPQNVFLKEPDEFRIIGKPEPRLDTPLKVNGEAIFGQDVTRPGMLHAAVARCPVFGGKLKSHDDSAAKKVKGVRHVVAIDGGVAVVADTFWAAKKGRDALKIDWDFGPNAKLDDKAIFDQFKQAVDSGADAHKAGDAESALGKAAKKLEAVFEVPYLAHGCMEPMNCTADVRADGCHVWAPTQAQTKTQQTAKKITGLPVEKIKVHTTFLGGGFGRRSEVDFVADAVQLSKAVGKPVKVIWTREDTTQHDFYRPATYNRLAAGLDENGNLVAWQHKIAGPSIMSRVFPNAVKNGIDSTSVEGAANLPYAVPNLHVTYAMVNPGVPVGFWRSVGSSQNAFITECFFDEVAHAAGKDPYELRRSMLKDKPHHLKVLELAASKAGWGKSLPSGHYHGIAVAEAFKSYCAQVAEVSIERGKVRVHRVVCAIDCGTAVNPNTIEAQMESAIVYGLTAALKGEINIKDGRVQQSNFNDYQLLRIDEMPEVEVHIVKSSDHPTGIGEPGTPPIAPAVANAVFAATGKPIRKLPIKI